MSKSNSSLLCSPRYHNGDIYQGKFQADVRHGHGVFHGCTSAASSSKPNLFIGEWRDDHRHGYGVMESTHRGEKYMGMWENDVRHGNGLVISLDGLYYEGVFSQNKLQVSCFDSSALNGNKLKIRLVQSSILELKKI